MDVTKEIRKIVEYQNAILPKHDRKNKEIVELIIETIEKAYGDEIYDFSKFTNIRLKQDDKKRNVKQYEPFSSEEVLCIYLKRLLDKIFHVAYPNRNMFMRSAFDAISSLKDMKDYTILKFDFMDFFNSVSSEFVFEKYIKEYVPERYQVNLLSDFVKKTKYAYAGLNTSNIICEIIAIKFDEALLSKMYNKGIIFYKRYIDDGLIIFNRYISKDECMELLSEVIKDVFYEPKIQNITQCRTKINTAKTKYIAKRNLSTTTKREFDFLGYEFVLSAVGKDKTELRYGITEKKIDKYTKRINSIVKDYVESGCNDIELLRHQIKAFSHRTVYRVNRYKTKIWKNKGFISNYCELRYRIEQLTPETKDFLQNVIIKAFINNGVRPVYFMKGNKKESIYNLYNNIGKYRTLLFVEKIGISFETLQDLCRKLNIATKDKSYDELVREYLIKVKVGH